MEDLILNYNEDYSLSVRLEKVQNQDSYHLVMVKHHTERPNLYGNTSSTEYFLNESQLRQIGAYIDRCLLELKK